MTRTHTPSPSSSSSPTPSDGHQTPISQTSPSTVDQFNINFQLSGPVSPPRVESPRQGGYTSAPFTRQSIGPEATLEAQLCVEDSSLAADTTLRGLVFEFPEGLPERLRGAVWSRLLGVERGASGNNDAGQTSGLQQFMSTGSLDEANQRVIRSDVERTRAHIPMFRDDEARKAMEQMLTYFCKTKGIKYKQGLNEVLAPFFFLKSPEFDMSEVYKCFSVFVNRFLPVFSDDEFTTLQCSFHLFKHLLMYHDPSLSLFLDYHGVSPELYVTPWFITVFASKSQINHLLCLWDFYIAEGDRFFFCFIALALMLQHRDDLFLTEVSQLPETLTQIGLRNYSELRKIWRSAKSLKLNTPSSFGTRMSTAQGNKAPLNQTLLQLESEEAFHILPQEVLRHCYGLHSVGQHPSNPALRWKLLVLDIRPRRQFDAGRLPPAVSLDLNDSDWRKRIVDLTASACSAPLGASPEAVAAAAARNSAKRPSDPGGTTKISHHGFEDLSGVESESTTGGVKREKQQLQQTQHLVPNYHICIMAGDASEQQTRLANYVYNILTQELYLKWISIARGGFKEAHRLALQSGLELIDHQPMFCSVCSSTESTTRTTAQRTKRGSTSSAASFFPGFSSKRSSTQQQQQQQYPSAQCPSTQPLGYSNLRPPDGSDPLSPDLNNRRRSSYNGPVQFVHSPTPEPSAPAGAPPHLDPTLATRTRRSQSLSQDRGNTNERQIEESVSPEVVPTEVPSSSTNSSSFSLMGALRLVRPGGSQRKKDEGNGRESHAINSNNDYHRTHQDDENDLKQEESQQSCRTNAPSTSTIISPMTTLNLSPGNNHHSISMTISNHMTVDHQLKDSQHDEQSISSSGQTPEPTNLDALHQSRPHQRASGRYSSSMAALRLKPHFLSAPGPPTSSCRIHSILPEHWRILGKLFQRLRWSDVQERTEVYLVPCRVESLKLDDPSKRSLLEVSHVKDHNASSEEGSVSQSAEDCKEPLVSESTALSFSKDLSTSRIDHQESSSAQSMSPERSIERMPTEISNTDVVKQPQDQSVQEGVESLSDLSFFVPDTRPCQLLVVGRELAVISAPYARNAQHQTNLTTTTSQEHVPNYPSTQQSLQLSTTTSTEESSSNNAKTSITSSASFVLVYSRYLLSDIVKITSKKASPNTLYFYFSDQKGNPELSLRFHDECTARRCITHVRGLYQFLRSNNRSSASPSAII